VTTDDGAEIRPTTDMRPWLGIVRTTFWHTLAVDLDPLQPYVASRPCDCVSADVIGPRGELIQVKPTRKVSDSVVTATGIGRNQLISLLSELDRSSPESELDRLLAAALRHFSRLWPTADWDPSRHLHHWFDLSQRAAIETLDRAASKMHLLLVLPDDDLSAPRQFIAMSATEAWQYALRRLVAWAQRAAPSRLWRYLLIAFARRSSDVSWSARPPGQAVTSSKRAPRGPDHTQMTTALSVICGGSATYA
jgi:hypothetical protein